MINKMNKNKLYKAANFIEELSWLIDKNKNIQISELSIYLREILNGSEAQQTLGNKYISSNPNKHFLVGTLPKLLSDNSLFQSNSMIVKFAKEVLDIKITRSDKRSRHEIIGIVVCETGQLNDAKLRDLVNALAILTGNEKKLIEIINKKNQNNFSWNDTIRSLSNTDYE